MRKSNRPSGISREAERAAQNGADALRPTFDPEGSQSALVRVAVGGVETDLPAKAVGFLLDVLDDLGAGEAITVAPAGLRVGTSEMGRLLGVTPKWAAMIVDLVDLPSTSDGAKRRVRLVDLTRYARARRMVSDLRVRR